MNKKPIGAWSMKYDQCVKCGTNEKPYFSRGMCSNCYFAAYIPANLAKVKSYKRKWYKKAGGRDWARSQREQRNYANLRKPTLKRDGYRCVKCGSNRLLCVHHKDGNGRGKSQPNNTIDNLETLCRACHMNIHRPKFPNQSITMRKAWITRRKNQQIRKEG